VTTGPGLRLRPLLVLVAVVIALHWLALKAGPRTFAWTPPKAPAPMSVRAVPPTPVDPPVPVPAPANAAPAPPPAPASRVTRRSPAPAAARLPESASNQAPERAATPVPALPRVAVPGSATWRYAVIAMHRGTTVSGRAELAWRHDGRAYEASLRLDAPPLPARAQRSSGELAPDGLAPLRFSDRLRSEEAAHFDRDGGRIVFSSNRPPAPLRGGAQDRLSVLLQLQALLAAPPARWAAGDTIVLQTATTREAEDWRFTVDGHETVALPNGPLSALKLTRAPQREYDLRLELWFVPGGDYGPVRLRLTPANGDWLDLQWSGTDKG
jgi:hypothetical protein